MRIYSGASESIWAVCRLAPERNQIAALTSRTLVVWDEAATDPVQSLPLPGRPRTHSRLDGCSTGKWLTASYGIYFLVWCWTGKEWITHFQDATPGLCVSQVGTRPARVLATRLGDGGSGVEFQILQRSLDTPHEHRGKVVSRFDAHPSCLAVGGVLSELSWWAADLSSDGAWLLISAREKAIHLWDVRAGQHAGSVKLRTTPNEAKFAPDGSLFAVDCGTTVYLYQTQTLDLVAAWKVKHCYKPQLAWSSDGNRLARTDLTSAVRLFDVVDRRESQVRGIPGHRGQSVAFSADGCTFLVGTVKGDVIVWDLDD